MDYRVIILSIVVFLILTFLLVGVLLGVKAKLLPSGPVNIQINWYINGVIQDDLTNQTQVSFLKPEGGGVMEYSYKAVDLQGFMTAPDDILLDTDNYEGFFNSEYYWNTSIDWSGSYQANPTDKSQYTIGYIDGTTGGTIGINWSNL